MHGAVVFARGAFGPYVTHDATADAGLAVAIVTYTRFDALRDDLRLGSLVVAAAARLAAVS